MGHALDHLFPLIFATAVSAITIRSTIRGSEIVAMRRSRPPEPGQASTSSPEARCMSARFTGL
jgi:hypothetical protein